MSIFYLLNETKSCQNDLVQKVIKILKTKSFHYIAGSGEALSSGGGVHGCTGRVPVQSIPGRRPAKLLPGRDPQVSVPDVLRRLSYSTR